MKITTIPEKTIQGISIRTQNADEMNPETAKIAALYERFDKNIEVDYQQGARVYGVYFDYESDASGMFSVLAGADQIASSQVELQQIKIEAGDYMVFKGEGGAMPQAVIDTWMRVWDFFSSDSEYQRIYKTDFEFYASETQVEIYIGIKKVLQNG